MPEVLTALMKTVDQLATCTEKQEKQITNLLTLTERLYTTQTELISAKSHIQALEAEPITPSTIPPNNINNTRRTNRKS